MHKSLFLIALIFICESAVSQDVLDLYTRADAAPRFDKLVYRTDVDAEWTKDNALLWYTVNTRKGTEYLMVDATSAKKQSAFDHERIAKSLGVLLEKPIQPYTLGISGLEYNEGQTTLDFVHDHVLYNVNLRNYRISKKKEIPQRNRNRGRFINWEGRDELGSEPVYSPDSMWIGYVQDYNVFVKSADGEEVHQLSHDATKSDFYSSYLMWSPDSKLLATEKITDVEYRMVNLVESSPEGQLQPATHMRPYLKPGDAVPIFKPALFNVVERRQISIDYTPWLFQYRLYLTTWKDNSSAVSFEFNQRGHQKYQVVDIDAETGKTRIIIDERSDTFIDYSGKKIRRDIGDDEIIWASERDGWNHLYLIDRNAAKVKNQITRGEWVVRGVVYVDESNRQIYFEGSGKNEGEDPYFIHYYRVNFDGSGLTDLTPENAQHNAKFSKDYKYLVDQYSRVDQAPITVLRSGETGKVLLTLEEADIEDLIATGWQYPEVFVTKARDGESEIWGNIYRPSDFDPSKTYPVIENIYAGPHSSFTPKTFSAFHRGISTYTEMGFVVVKLDGMGTSNRSKAFHDVCWQNLKDAGFPDRKIWIQAAADKYNYLDISKLGIYGTSAGGQNSMGALLFHSDFYKVAVSSCGCHDNRMDKIWWNEQWMGYPIGKHYEESSNVVNASKLEGDLLLMVGELDDNVDPASTYQVVDALIKEGKEFEFVVLPGVKHTAGGEYGERKRRDFFVEHILGLDPPNWNKIAKKKD